MLRKIFFVAILIGCCASGILNQSVINLNLQKTVFQNGPQEMGVGMGHAHVDSNWLAFTKRLNVNAARLFINLPSDLRAYIGAEYWGKNLDGKLVENSGDYFSAIATLRSTNGRSLTYTWANPVNWSSIFKLAGSPKSKSLFGSNENIIDNLKLSNMNVLLVEHIGCTSLSFKSMDPLSPSYWSDRWELYKFSYALAIWSRTKEIKMIEFYNEPDIDMAICLNAEQFLDYYTIRSESIQNAYYDYNNDFTQNVDKSYVEIKVVASAMAFGSYNFDPKKSLTAFVVNNKKTVFNKNQRTLPDDWTNMHIYSYHSYSKTGPQMLNVLTNLTNSIRRDLGIVDKFPIAITEHNAHFAAEWNTINSTPDSAFEASRLASQIINLVIGKIDSQYTFKFSITPNTGSLNFGAKLNGLHWGENSVYPFQVTDTTLSAESVRLLNQLKESKVFPVTSNDLPAYNRTYLASMSKDEAYYYLYAVNDNATAVNLNIDLSQLNISPNTKVIIENVGNGYWGEVSSILTVESNSITVFLDSYSTIRITIPTTLQQSITTNALLSCTAKAGSQSNQVGCSDAGVYVGTSNTIQHENTNVAFIKFNNNPKPGINSKSILSLNFEQVIGPSLTDDMTILVLGLNNNSYSSNWDQTTVSWTSLSNATSSNGVLTPLSSNITIDASFKNFINWKSLSDLSIVGHVTITKKSPFGEKKLIDVSDYVSKAIRNGQSSISFVLYRPYRHPAFQTQYGSIPADDLSNGSILKFSSVSSSNPPKLIQYGLF